MAWPRQHHAGSFRAPEDGKRKRWAPLCPRASFLSPSMVGANCHCAVATTESVLGLGYSGGLVFFWNNPSSNRGGQPPYPSRNLTYSGWFLPHLLLSRGGWGGGTGVPLGTIWQNSKHLLFLPAYWLSLHWSHSEVPGRLLTA